MELFVIDRYTGDGSTLQDAPDESELRSILMERAHKRKILMERDINSENEFHSFNNFASHKECMTNASLNDNNKSPNYESTDKTSKSKMKTFIRLDAQIRKMNKKRKNEVLCQNVPTHHSTVEGKSVRVERTDLESTQSSLFSPVKMIEESCNKINDKSESLSFSVLGSNSFSKPTKVKRSIPRWLANPSIVSVNLKKLETPVDSIPGLDEIFVKKLKDNNITNFFPVQGQIIPWLLENAGKPSFYWPSDICVSAPTGSGKTLAFVLPILQALHKRIVPQIRAIVVLPVQDLAAQVYQVFKTYSEPTKLEVLLLSKERVFAEEQALICKKDKSNGFACSIDIVITTAGRLVDHLMYTKGLSLKHLKYLVIDEADRVMEDMQNDWLYHLTRKLLLESSGTCQGPVLTLSALSAKSKLPQKMLFSATLSQDPEKLQQLGLFQPKLFTSIVTSSVEEQSGASLGRFVGKYTTPAELEEYFAISTKASKPLIIHHLLVSKSWKTVLCFVNSVKATKRLSFLLRKMNRQLRIKSISAKLNPSQRKKLIQDFSRGLIDVLISSDALARGIDLPNVKYVISYNFPKYLKTYIHRIGRTGRAGNTGTSLILLTEKEVEKFEDIIKDAGKKTVKQLTIEEDDLEQYSEGYEVALNKLKSHLEQQKEKSLSLIKSLKYNNKDLRKRY